MNHELTLHLIDNIALGIAIFFLVFGFNIFINFFASLVPQRKAKSSFKYTDFGVLVPARNESDVIDNICRCLITQSYPIDHFMVYFILESEDDPSVDIIKRYGFKYFVRDNLTESRRTKGFALQECIAYFKRNNIHFDAYVIFDADNIVPRHYLEVMNNVRQNKKAEVGVTHRSFTNNGENFFTVSSAILFTHIMSITAKARSLLYNKAVLSGTG